MLLDFLIQRGRDGSERSASLVAFSSVLKRTIHFKAPAMLTTDAFNVILDTFRESHQWRLVWCEILG